MDLSDKEELTEQEEFLQAFSTFNTGLVSLRQNHKGNDQISIFTYYLRDNFDYIHNDQLKDIIIFIPTDDSIKQLIAKPWEFPSHISPEMDEKTADEVSKNNVLSFVQSHVVDVSNSGYQMPNSEVERILLKSVNNGEVILKYKNDVFSVVAKDGKSADILSTSVQRYGEQSITLVTIKGCLDWPGKKL